MIDQLTVCLPDTPGALAQMSSILGDRGIQIYGLMVSHMGDFGLARILCDRPRATAALLAERGYSALISRVVACEVENVPGAFGRLLARIASGDLNVEYAYTCSLGDRTVDVIKATGEPLEIKLRECGLEFLRPEEIYRPDEE